MTKHERLNGRLGLAAVALACAGVAAGVAFAQSGGSGVTATVVAPAPGEAALLQALREDQPVDGVGSVTRGVRLTGAPEPVTAKGFTTRSGRDALLVTVGGRSLAGGCAAPVSLRVCVAAFEPSGLYLAGRAQPSVTRVVVVNGAGMSLESPVVEGLWVIHVPMKRPGTIGDLRALDASGARTALSEAQAGRTFVNRIGGTLASMGRKSARTRR